MRNLVPGAFSSPKQLVCKGPLYLFKTGIAFPASGSGARGPVDPWTRGPGARGPRARGPGARGPGARGPGARGPRDK